MVVLTSPWLNSAKGGGTDSPAARQEFRWTEEKKQMLELRTVTTTDRQVRTQERTPSYIKYRLRASKMTDQRKPRRNAPYKEFKLP